MSVRAALLQLLDEGPRHGYQLKVDFEARTGKVWPLNIGQVYTTLDRLVRDGLVEERPTPEGDAHRTYRLTEDGRRELKGWLAGETTTTAPPRDELITKVLVAVGRSRTHAIDVIEAQRRSMFEALQDGRHRQRRRHGPQRLAHDALLTRIEADLAWLDRCEELVRAGAVDDGEGDGAPSPGRGRRGR